MPTTTCAWRVCWSLKRQHEGEYLEHHGRPVLEAFFTHTHGEGSPVADQDDNIYGRRRFPTTDLCPSSRDRRILWPPSHQHAILRHIRGAIRNTNKGTIDLISGLVNSSLTSSKDVKPATITTNLPLRSTLLDL